MIVASTMSERQVLENSMVAELGKWTWFVRVVSDFMRNEVLFPACRRIRVAAKYLSRRMSNGYCTFRDFVHALSERQCGGGNYYKTNEIHNQPLSVPGSTPERNTNWPSNPVLPQTERRLIMNGEFRNNSEPQPCGELPKGPFTANGNINNFSNH
jgi:hypothetical protein